MNFRGLASGPGAVRAPAAGSGLSAFRAIFPGIGIGHSAAWTKHRAPPLLPAREYIALVNKCTEFVAECVPCFHCQSCKEATITLAWLPLTLSIVILAAGKGTRMRSDLAKVLHRAGGRPLLEHVIRACQPLKAAQVLAVVGHQAEEVGALAESLGADTVKQQPQRGTGHALQVARRAMRKSAKLVIVVPGDAPLLRAETLLALLDTHRRGEAAATILSAELERAYGLRPRGARFRRPRASHGGGKSRDAGAARHPRSEFQHLLLHAGKTVAVPERVAAGQRASRVVSD